MNACPAFFFARLGFYVAPLVPAALASSGLEVRGGGVYSLPCMVCMVCIVCIVCIVGGVLTEGSIYYNYKCS